MRRVAAGLCGAVIFFAGWCVGVYWSEKDLPIFDQSRKVTHYGNGYMVRTSGEIDPDHEGMTYTFEAGADMTAAKRLLPELLVPGYIPEGYTFDSLSISTYMSGRWIFSYIYIRDSDELTISQEKGKAVAVLWDGPETEKAAILNGLEI